MKLKKEVKEIIIWVLAIIILISTIAIYIKIGDNAYNTCIENGGKECYKLKQ